MVHKAQAMCYAYMYGEKQKLHRVGVQMTYCNLDTEARPSPTAFTAGKTVVRVFPVPVGAWIKRFFFLKIVRYTSFASFFCPSL